MPKTNFQKAVFVVMMGIVMSMGMETYNLCMQGVSLEHYLKALVMDLPLMVLMVMIFQPCIAVPVVSRLVSIILKEDDNAFKRQFVTTSFTVLVMCPLMSLAATIFFKMQLGNLPSVWFKTFLYNLPIAYLWQFFVAGPLVRKVYNRCFSDNRQ